ncbi:MAG: hypothetical protein JSS68_08335 [Actinobacteria bacterium]|nr:hypothetical protein [Actinomycetota bacterium]
MSIRRRLAIGIAASLAALLLSASAASAALPSADVAGNLAEQLLDWAKLVIIPTAAIMALPALFRRDVGHALITLVIVLIVGMFAFDSHGVQSLVEEVAKKVLG